MGRTFLAQFAHKKDFDEFKTFFEKVNPLGYGIVHPKVEYVGHIREYRDYRCLFIDFDNAHYGEYVVTLDTQVGANFASGFAKALILELSKRYEITNAGWEDLEPFDKYKKGGFFSELKYKLENMFKTMDHEALLDFLGCDLEGIEVLEKEYQIAANKFLNGEAPELIYTDDN